jgi:hypothetical protein
MNVQSVADVEGPLPPDEGPMTGLIERCVKHWSVPVNELPDHMVATYLQQGIATSLMIAEARRRIDSGIFDDSEWYEGQLAEALRRATGT